MLARFVIDASAWIEYLHDTEKGRKIAALIEKEENECQTPSTVVAEIVSKAIRSQLDFKTALTAISNLSNIYDVTDEIATLAGQIHVAAKRHNKDFGMLDAFVVAVAKKLNAKIITADLDFKLFREAIVF